MKKQCIIFLALMTGVVLNVSAQEFKTDISIREQLLNNKVPGAKYGTPAPAKKTVDEPRIPAYASVRFGKAIKEGKLGMPVSTNTGNATAAKPVPVKKDGIKLPSEMTTEEIKAIAEAAKQSASKAARPPLEQPVESKETQVIPEKQQQQQ